MCFVCFCCICFLVFVCCLCFIVVLFVCVCLCFLVLFVDIRGVCCFLFLCFSSCFLCFVPVSVWLPVFVSCFLMFVVCFCICFLVFICCLCFIVVLFLCLSMFSCFVCWNQGCLLFFVSLFFLFFPACFCLGCHCTYQVCVDPPCHVVSCMGCTVGRVLALPVTIQLSVSLGPTFAHLWVDMTARLMGYSACWGHKWQLKSGRPFVIVSTPHQTGWRIETWTHQSLNTTTWPCIMKVQVYCSFMILQFCQKVHCICCKRFALLEKWFSWQVNFTNPWFKNYAINSQHRFRRCKLTTPFVCVIFCRNLEKKIKVTCCHLVCWNKSPISLIGPGLGNPRPGQVLDFQDLDISWTLLSVFFCVFRHFFGTAWKWMVHPLFGRSGPQSKPVTNGLGHGWGHQFLTLPLSHSQLTSQNRCDLFVNSWTFPLTFYMLWSTGQKWCEAGLAEIF